jgi:hypothetical protein
MKRSRVILILVIVAFLIGGGIGFYLYNKPPAKTANQKAVATVTASELYNAFEADEMKANSTYLGKIIEVEGAIAGVSANESGRPVLQLNNQLFGVSCSFDDDFFANHKQVINRLKAGDSVKLKCKCDGMLTDVVLTQCVLIKSNIQ